MTIDMNGPDIEAGDKVKALILESVNAWKNYKKRFVVKEQYRCNTTDQERKG